MKIPLLGALAALAACSSVPPGPPLPAAVHLEARLAEEAFERHIEITVDESGQFNSSLKRSLLRDQRRHGQLTSEQMQQLSSLLDRWTPAPPKAAAGTPWGTLTYGSKQAAWSKESTLPADLAAVVKWLRETTDETRPEGPRRTSRGRDSYYRA